MKVSEVRGAMYLELAPHLPGWKLVKKLQAFVRPITGGEQRIVVDVVDYRPEFRVTLTLVTKLEVVEELFHRIHGTTPSPLDVTAATQLAYFHPDEPAPKQLAVHDEAEIAGVVATLAPTLRDRALPLLDRTRTVEGLDAAMNGEDRAFDTSYPLTRIMHALIVARLARNPHFDALVHRYHAESSRYPDQQKKGVADLVAELSRDPA